MLSWKERGRQRLVRLYLGNKLGEEFLRNGEIQVVAWMLRELTRDKERCIAGAAKWETSHAIGRTVPEGKAVLLVKVAEGTNEEPEVKELMVSERGGLWEVSFDSNSKTPNHKRIDPLRIYDQMSKTLLQKLNQETLEEIIKVRFGGE